MDSFEERLAEAVRKYENLYDTSLKSYKDPQVANKSWKEVARSLDTEETVCRKRWRYLRDKFAKAKRRVNERKRLNPGAKKSVPALFASLQWLDKHIKPRETTTNSVAVSQKEEEMDSEPEEGFEFEAALAALDKRRAEQDAAIEAGRQRMVAMLQMMDPVDRYLLHVGDFMRSLPPKLLSDFKWKLQNVMHETEQRAAQLGNSDAEL